MDAVHNASFHLVKWKSNKTLLKPFVLCNCNNTMGVVDLYMTKKCHITQFSENIKENIPWKFSDISQTNHCGMLITFIKRITHNKI